MKKLLIALLAVVLCLSLVACGTDPAGTTGDDVETTDGPESTKAPETTEPEIMDSDTLAVGEDDGAGFGPINQ